MGIDFVSVFSSTSLCVVSKNLLHDVREPIDNVIAEDTLFPASKSN